MSEREKLFFKNRDTFRNWLIQNHNKSSGIWMVYLKKHTNEPCIEYREALEEALCFGWIDSLIKTIDERQYLRMFTPRTNINNWSDVNKKLVLTLIEQGKMTEAGLLKIDRYVQTGKVDWVVKPKEKAPPKPPYQVPDFIGEALSKEPAALAYFNQLSPSNKKRYTDWITIAKREETLQRRLRETVELLKEKQLLGLK